MKVSLADTPVPWAQIYQTQFVFEDECWQTCGGGFCCSNNSPDFQFQLLLTGGANLLYLNREYEFAHQHGVAADNLPDTDPSSLLSLDYGSGRALGAVKVNCRLLGACDGCIDKPLLCRLYPFIPVFSIDGVIETLHPGSIFELTSQTMGWTSPCSVALKRSAFMERWTGDVELLAPLRHPYIMFHLAAYGILVEAFRTGLANDTKLAGLTGAEFWRTWELVYLSGRLFDWPLIRSQLSDLHDTYHSQFGDFLT